MPDYITKRDGSLQKWNPDKIVKAVSKAMNSCNIENSDEKAKDVTRKRLYLETMERVFPNIKKFIIDSDTGNSLLKFLPIDGNPSNEIIQNQNTMPRSLR